jgi:hypothetical protein
METTKPLPNETSGASNLRRIAALCVSPRSPWRKMPGVECYTKNHPVELFRGGMPIVAHPPCRAWSAFTRHQARPSPGEKELGPLCVHWLLECGGILEHPAHSRLFYEFGLPLPGKSQGELWTRYVEQSWWGDTRSKGTWLCFCRIEPRHVFWPLSLHDPRGDRARWDRLSKAGRSKTPPRMVQWLAGVARLVFP